MKLGRFDSFNENLGTSDRFNFEDWDDTDISGPAIDSLTHELIDDIKERVSREIDSKIYSDAARRNALIAIKKQITSMLNDELTTQRLDKKFNESVDNATPRAKLKSKLEKKFPGMWLKLGEDFESSCAGQLWTGEGSTVNVNGNEIPMFDYYADDYQEKTYIMGVYKGLHDFLDGEGWYVECNDPGTYMIAKK